MTRRFFLSAIVTSCFAFVSIFSLESFRKPPKKTDPVSIGEFVYTVSLERSKKLSKVSPEWYHEFLEPELKDSFFAPVFEAVSTKKMRVMRPSYPFTTVMQADSAAETVQSYWLTDIVDEYGMETGEYDTTYGEISTSEVVAVTFHEEWLYDAASSTLIKKVKGIMPVMEDYSREMLYGAFYVPFTDGPIAKRSAGITGITYDFNPDTDVVANGLHYGFFERSHPVQVKQKTAAASLLTSVQKQSHAKGTTLCYPVFPFNTAMTGNDQQNILSSVDAAKLMRFREDWTVDYSTMRFVKYVRGINLGQLINMKVNQGSEWAPDSVQQDVAVYHAFVPMNGSFTQSELPAVLVVDRIAYGGVYNYGNSFINYPRFETKDSVKLAGVLQEIFESARSGKIEPFADLDNHFRFYAWEKEYYRIPAENKNEVFWPTNTYYSEWDNYYNNPPRDTIRFSEFCGYRFYESWRFDADASTFTKDIYAIGAMRYSQQPGIEDLHLRAGVAFGYYNPTEPVDSIMQPKYLVAKNVITPVEVNSVAQEGMNDTYEPFFEYYNYISHDDNLPYYKRYQLVESVIQHVQAGKMTAWSATVPERKLSIAEFNSVLDSIMKQENVQRPYIHAAITEIAFDEDWYYNPKNGQFYKHVNAITFGRRLFTANEYDVNREYEGAEFRPGLRYFTVRMNQPVK